ncbi:MAG: hypothetical protein HOP33_07185 [Verrucomicrobia bacterium]|nr:hypothetical protein [Verrucomicrobiota bacterium]
MNPTQKQIAPVCTTSTSKSVTCLAVACLLALTSSQAVAQSPGVLYTWPGTGNDQQWAKNFGPSTVVVDNSIAGELRVTETGGAGATVAISDGANRVRESSTAASGGLDVTGLDYLEFDIGHSGVGNINVQFFVQASPGYSFVSLGPDVAVTPGVNTYQLDLSGLTPEQAVYIRTIGFNVRDHAVEGDVVWTLREVRAGGTPLATRDLITHDDIFIDGGLQGAIVNFDRGAVLGNTGQDQTGLSHNPAGSGSLEWTDLGNSNGAAISWGNGTAWDPGSGGNTFWIRPTDLSNYDKMVIRMSATEVIPGTGGLLGVQGFFQVNGFGTFQTPGAKALPIDGQFHDLEFPLAGMVSMNVVDQTGINLFNHTNDLRINVDSIRFAVVPTIKSVEKSGQDITLKFHTSPGQTYSVEYFSDLNPGSPTNTLGGNVLGDGLDAVVTDTNAVSAAVTRFYRLNLLP